MVLYGAVPLLPHTSSGRGTQLSTGKVYLYIAYQDGWAPVLLLLKESTHTYPFVSENWEGEMNYRYIATGQYLC
jgi:hypothetical protein